jgi:hypothetical protein
MTERSTGTGTGTADGGDDEYVCHACGESFDSAEALHRHVREQGLVE